MKSKPPPFVHGDYTRRDLVIVNCHERESGLPVSNTGEIQIRTRPADITKPPGFQGKPRTVGSFIDHSQSVCVSLDDGSTVAQHLFAGRQSGLGSQQLAVDTG